MISSGRIKQAMIKPTIRQKVWNYMRRNRIFIIADVMAITGANYKNLREMFKVYEHAGYIKVVRKGKPFTSTQLKLIKCTGVKVPTHDKNTNTLFDYNIEEEIKIVVPSAYEKVLSCLNKSLISKEEINKQSDLSEATTQKSYVKLKELQIMTRVIPTRRNTFGYRLFNVDIQKAQKLLEHIREEKVHVVDKKSTDEQKTKEVSEKLIKLLDAMTEKKMSKRGLDEKASLRLGSAKNYWDRFIKRGVVSEIVPTQRDSKRVLFKVYPEKVKELKAELLLGVKL